MRVPADFEEQAYQAAALLDRLMDGEAPPTDPLLIPPKPSVVRQSIDIVAIKDVEAAKAVRYLMANLHDSRLGVPDVVAATASSRSALFKAFRKHVGRPIAEEIRCLHRATGCSPRQYRHQQREGRAPVS